MTNFPGAASDADETHMFLHEHYNILREKIKQPEVDMARALSTYEASAELIFY